jgi:SpoVK/Ycf46/Vps4 family AAA+-type ATPase
MSESEYMNRLQDEFLAKHPQGDGWQVRRIAPESYGVYTPYLPAFLRAKHPELVRRERILCDVAWNSNKKNSRRSISEEPTHRRGVGMDEDNWYGELEFIWEGGPLSYRRVAAWGPEREQTISWIACKSSATLASLWKALSKWEKYRSRRLKTVSIFGEGSIPRLKLNWADVILPVGMVEDIRSNIQSFLLAKKEYRSLDLPYRRGFLFTGAPGGGKTMMVKVIAAQARASVYILPLKAKMDDYDVNRAFSRASENGPAILILEDLDRLCDNKDVSVSYLLNLLDGMSTRKGVIVIATTNAPEKLDAALLHRPSRFDRVWHFPLPSFDERLRLLRKKALKRFSESALVAAASGTQGFTMAYVQEVVVNAFLKIVTERRVARDADLAASVEVLKTQQKDCHKADCSIKPEAAVGFSAVPGQGA